MKKVYILCNLFTLIVTLPILVFFSHRQQQYQQHAASLSPTPSSQLLYHVSGKQILDSNNALFIPNGIGSGILPAQSNWRTNGFLTYFTQDMMQATHDFWHANTTRIQVSTTALFAQSPYDTAYLAAIDQQISWATQLGMNTILTLQYEGAGNTGQIMPTQDSLAFWHLIAPHYASNQRVFFDIFNEPRIWTGNITQSWNIWQNGGTYNGIPYVGMQQLVDTIRNTGAQNLIFAEGLAAGESLQGLVSREGTTPHLLIGGNIVYAIHPYFNATQHHTPAEWDQWFGTAATIGNFPVVNDEWNSYESTKGECVTDAPTVVPQFLSYLKNHNIGLIGYGNWPGTLIRGWDMRNPTTYTGTTTLCDLDTSIHANMSATAQGAGQLIQQYLAANDSIPSITASPTLTLVPTASPTPTPISCTNTSTTKGSTGLGNDMSIAEQDAQDMQNAGINWARFDWTRVTGTLSLTANYTNVDTLVQIAKHHNIQLDAIVFGTPKIDLGTQADRDASKAWLAQTVNRYKNDIHYWEIGNEENLPGEWNIDISPTSDQTLYNQSVDNYVAHLQDYYTTIKTIDPTANVLIGGLSEWKSERYLTRLIQDQAYQYFDIMAFHPYQPTPAQVMNRIDMLKSYMAQVPAFAAKPISVTEVGWNTPIPNYLGETVPDEHTKAVYLTQVMPLLKNDGVNLTFWYDLHEPVGWLVAGHGLTIRKSTTDVTYLPAYYAYQAVGSGQNICPSITFLPTPTPVPGSTTFAVTICPHGLGNCGDNANPQGGNTNPTHPQRAVTLTMYDQQNMQVGQAQGQVYYPNVGANFQGSVNVSNLASGNYLITEHLDGFLSKQVPGIIAVTQGQTVTLAPMTLTTGDMNTDNQLDIEDYNILLSCYGSKYTTASCLAPGTSTSPGADINDDGSVGGADYNLFLRELSVQHGG